MFNLCLLYTSSACLECVLVFNSNGFVPETLDTKVYDEIMDEQSRRFKQTNKESLDILLKPFRDNITEFRERVERIYSAENGFALQIPPKRNHTA